MKMEANPTCSRVVGFSEGMRKIQHKGRLTGSHGSICWEKEAGKKREEAGCLCGDGKTIGLVVFGRVSPGLMSAI